MTRKFLMIFVFAIFLIGFATASVTYSPTEKLTCNDVEGGFVNCVSEINLGVTYVQEDGDWKHYTEAQSLKDKGWEIKILNEDPDFPMEVIDFNSSSITVKLKKWSLFGIDVPVEVWKPNKNVDLNKSQEKVDKAYKLTHEKIKTDIEKFNLWDLGSKKVTYDFGTDYILKFGFNSTEVTLTDGNITEDTYVAEDAGDTNYGSGASLSLFGRSGAGSSARRRMSMIKFDTSSIQTPATIHKANFSMWATSVLSPGDATAFLSNNQTWSELEWTYNNTIRSPYYMDLNETVTVTEAYSDANVYLNMDVKAIVQTSKNLEQENTTIFINSTGDTGGGNYNSFNSAEGAVKPILYVNFTFVDPDLDPSVSLNSPIDDYNSTEATITFNGTASDDINLTSVSFIVDDVYQNTNSSEFNNSNYLFTKTFTDGSYDWKYEACDNSSQCTNTSARTVNVDTTFPLIEIIAPSLKNNFITIGDDDFLNVTATETNLDTCWYDYNGANVTYSCTSGDQENETITIVANVYSTTVWVNDTFGNVNSSSYTWEYLLAKESESFSATVLEGGTSTFTINFLTNGTGISIANLSYNGGQNIGTLSSIGNNYTITKAVTSPVVDADTNVSFFWKITQGSLKQSMVSQNQTVLDFSVDNCSTNTEVLYNFTIVDEREQTLLVPVAQSTLGKIDLQIYSTTGGSIKNFSKQYNQTNPYAVCLSNGLNAGESYVVDLQNQYSAQGYVKELFNIQQSTITSASMGQNITLYNLDNITSQVFTVTYRDSSYLPVEGALMTVQRKYIDEGVFKTVEAPITDSDGETLVSLELYNPLYTFIFSKDGTALSTFDNQRVKCTNLVLGQCDLAFNDASAPVSTDKYTIVDGITYFLSYDNDTRIVSGTFLIEDNTLKTVSINVTLLDGINSPICSNQWTSSSGTVTCTIPVNFTNGTALVTLYQDGVFEGQAQIYLGGNSRGLYGKNIVFLSIFMLLILIGVGVNSDPKIAGFFLLIGAIVGIGMNLTSNTGFIGPAATFLWLVIAILLVIIKGSKRE